MDSDRLNVKAFAIACGIIGGLGMLFVGWASMVFGWKPRSSS
jgi:hypothetical protein